MTDANGHPPSAETPTAWQALSTLSGRRRLFAATRFGAALATFFLFLLLFQHVPQWFAAPGPSGDRPNLFSMALFALVPAALVWFTSGRAAKRALRRSMGRELLQPLARTLCPDCSYDPDATIGADTFNASLLFDSIGDGMSRLENEGVFSGTAAGRDFLFTAVRAEKKVPHGCRLRGGELFAGLFLRLVLDDAIDGSVQATPRSAHVTPDDMRERLGEEDGATVAEFPIASDKVFDRWFVSLATDTKSAALPPPVRALLVSLLEKDHYQPFFSRRGNLLHLALATRRLHWRLPAKWSLSPDDAEQLNAAYREDMELMLRLASSPAFNRRE